MHNIVEKLYVIPEIYRGRFVDIDKEINLAYEKYPFPWPSEKPYAAYALEDMVCKRDESVTALRGFLREFRVDEGSIRGKVVLDLGAGVGWDAMALAFCGAGQVYAIDNSMSSVTHGRRFAHLLGLKNVSFVRTSLYEIDQLKVVPDMIIAKGVLHHVFDLSRLARAIYMVAKPGTELLFTHSRFSTRMGFYKYFNNHLAWMLGGADIEKRIDVGIKIFRKWTRGYSSDVIRDRTNDLAGVFYMARSIRAVRRIFLEQGFEVEVVSNETYVEHFSSLAGKLERKAEGAGERTAMRVVFSAMLWQARVCNFLSARLKILNRLLGFLVTVMFTMVPHRFRVVKTGIRERQSQCD